jgi:hypothetical protein
VKGASQLINIRGHETFNDEFEKSILHSNASDLVRYPATTAIIVLTYTVLRISLEWEAFHRGSQKLEGVGPI